MKTYTGTIEDMGHLTDESGRGGKIQFIIIGDKTFRRISCPTDVYSFLKIGMTATIYMHELPILGKLVLGVKDMSNSRKFMARHIEVVASCIMRFFILGLFLILPSILLGTWSIWMIVPLITPAILYFDYVKAKVLN
jgi:hypothetical protein